MPKCYGSLQLHNNIKHMEGKKEHIVCCQTHSLITERLILVGPLGLSQA